MPPNARHILFKWTRFAVNAMHIASSCRIFPRKLTGKSRHFCDDTVCLDPVWKLSRSRLLREVTLFPEDFRRAHFLLFRAIGLLVCVSEKSSETPHRFNPLHPPPPLEKLRGIQTVVVSKNNKYNNFGFGGIKRPS